MKRILSFSAVVLSASVCAQAAPTPANLGDGYPANALTVTRQAGSNGPVLYLTVRARKFEETGGGSSRLEGDVAMQFPYGLAQGDRATMTRAGMVTFTNNVTLLYGGQVIRGTKLVFDGHSGVLEMNGKRMLSGLPACKVPHC